MAGEILVFLLLAGVMAVVGLAIGIIVGRRIDDRLERSREDGERGDDRPGA